MIAVGEWSPKKAEWRVVTTPCDVSGDWFVNAESGESVRAAYPGEPVRPGLAKVEAWDYFAKRVA